jgi:transcriptional regulator with XRE-family HTH domain
VTTTPPPPEADLIREHRSLAGYKSARQAAIAAGLSPTWWREIERGLRRAGPDSLASMARVVWVTPEELTAAGRPDAAEELRRELAATPEDVTRMEVQHMADRIGRVRGLTEGQKRHMAERFQQVIDEQG